MRIGQYSDSFLPVVDGVGRVVVSYAQTMGQMGHEVTVFAPRTDMGDTSAFPYRILTYNTVQMPGKMPYRIGFPQLDLAFDKKLDTIDLDIIHVHSPFMSGHAGIHLAKKRGIPVIGSFHSKYYDDFAQVLKSDLLAKGGVRYVVDFYEQCDEVWAVSEATAETLKEYGYPGKVYVMPNGTDIRTLDPAVLPELRARFALPQDVPLLLYVGQMNWKKNIRRILEAAKILQGQDCRFHLVLAGQGPHRDEIEEAANTMGLGGQVTFTGHLQDTRLLDGLYALASLFVFPSLYDNAPMVLREAAMMGTPAVLVAKSSAAENVRDEENGFTCEDTAESLADAIARGLGDEQRRKQVGQAARETIPVSWNTIMEDVLERYEMLINDKR